jgi:membrane protein YdbS with pleckstrin-like domain
MKAIHELSPDERKRLFAELRQDSEYKKNRKTLISFVLIGAVCMLAITWMMMDDILSFEVGSVALFVFILFNQFFIFRIGGKQKGILERLRQEMSGKRSAKRRR